jgi:predicted AlkP superfamily pyrophosphatase or phosphodiesterase
MSQSSTSELQDIEAQDDYVSFLPNNQSQVKQSPSTKPSPFMEFAKRYYLYFLAVFVMSLILGVIIIAYIYYVRRKPKPNIVIDVPLNKTVFLFSIDGFRYDYIHKYSDKCVNLRKLAANGVIAEKLIPSFPTKTFPNHYTLVTGMYPATHGIIGNNIYDKKLQSEFHMSTLDAYWWNNAEPIWITTERLNYSASVVFWPGSNVDIHGRRPTRYQEVYSDDYGDDNKIDLLMSYLDEDMKNATKGYKQNLFYASYFATVDHAGHDTGPDSVETAEAVASVDRTIGYFMAQLQKRKIDPLKDINIVIVSDHGMANLNSSCRIDLKQIVNATDLAQVKLMNQGTFVDMYSLNQSDTTLIERIFQQLKTAENNYQVFKPDTIPARLHYTQVYDKFPDRAPDLFVAPNSECTVAKSFNSLRGDHGYDNQVDAMGALFIASGPKIVTESKPVSPFENIHIYPLLANIMEFTDIHLWPKIDGSLAAVYRLLKNPSSNIG